MWSWTSRPSERLAQRAARGEIVTFETRHRRKDGTTFPVEIRTGTFEQAGKLFHLALARDITERKLAEESIRQSEAYLTEAQRMSHTGSWALDVATNRYVYTSEEFDRLFGFDRQAEAPDQGSRLGKNAPRRPDKLETDSGEIRWRKRWTPAASTGSCCLTARCGIFTPSGIPWWTVREKS